jgi:isopentenyl diphosphate isomerase/L-lactate dehydrogenase-like FMN-dependent dehydrogenase
VPASRVPLSARTPASRVPLSAAVPAHLDLCATGDVGFRDRTTLLECVRLVHDALPELSLDELDLGDVLGKRLRAPIVIAAMTGGTSEAEEINRTLAAIAERARLRASASGSQRAMLKRPEVGVHLPRARRGAHHAGARQRGRGAGARDGHGRRGAHRATPSAPTRCACT